MDAVTNDSEVPQIHEMQPPVDWDAVEVRVSSSIVITIIVIVILLLSITYGVHKICVRGSGLIFRRWPQAEFTHALSQAPPRRPARASRNAEEPRSLVHGERSGRASRRRPELDTAVWLVDNAEERVSFFSANAGACALHPAGGTVDKEGRNVAGPVDAPWTEQESRV